ncbi:MAG: hypothetical protein ACI9C4_000903 [Paraglaciecola sp.]
MKVDSSLGALQSSIAPKLTKPGPQRESGSDKADVAALSGTIDQGRSTIRQGGVESFDQAESYRQQKIITEQLSLRSQHAVQAYHSISKEQQRGEIQQLLGVDTFA